MEVYNIIINSKYTSEIEYLTNIANSLKEFDFNVNVDVDDSISVVNYLINDEVYHTDSFLSEQGLLDYIGNSTSKCGGCSGSCSSC